MSVLPKISREECIRWMSHCMNFGGVLTGDVSVCHACGMYHYPDCTGVLMANAAHYLEEDENEAGDKTEP